MSVLARAAAMAIAIGLLVACQSDDRKHSQQPIPTASPSKSSEPDGIQARPVDELVAQAEEGVVAVNPDGDVAIRWQPPPVDEEHRVEPGRYVSPPAIPTAVTVRWSSGLMSAFELNDPNFEIFGVAGGFVLRWPTVTREAILVRADGTMAALRRVSRPTLSTARELERQSGWSFDPEELTWWSRPAVPTDGAVLVDDQGRAWYMEIFSPMDGVLDPPAEAVVEWAPVGTDLHSATTQEHRTPAVNGSLVVFGDRIAIINGTVIDQSRDNGRTWQATPMDDRWRGMFIRWFANASGRLFRSTPDGSHMIARSLDNSWTTFEAVTVPAGFDDIQAAGDLLWSVRHRYVKNKQLPAEVIISRDDGDRWTRISLQSIGPSPRR